tara:strand:- start:2061 stop:2489 length:429 start_codon:yes stop_codon:yes gene_type:complete
MKKTVGCFTEEKLKELSQEPNTVVMQPTYDTIFEPWPASKVSDIMDQIVSITLSKKKCSAEEIRSYCKEKKILHDFSEKYQIMFKQITIPEFVADSENIKVVKQMILLKSAVDSNITSNEEAQAQAADLAMKSLVSRVKHKK